MPEAIKPIVVITGAAGNIGTTLIEALRSRYFIIGLDRTDTESADASFTFDLTSAESVQDTLERLRDRHGNHIAAVIHLAAYFDFSGEESPLYDAVNVEGTRQLLRALQRFNVERFIYSSTMLVHQPGAPGTRIVEDTPVAPRWAYPQSKAETERIIVLEAGHIPYTLLRLAGVYDETSLVPTLAHQIARIYEKDLKSHLYSGDTEAGQAFLHKEDMVDAFVRTVDRRRQLPRDNILLIGEAEVASYEQLQQRLGELIHGEREWQTLQVPKTLAKAGAWLEAKAEPLVPDDFDQGEKPFIRPFMVEMASDHYHLNTEEAERQLGWHARHNILDSLEAIVRNLKNDPAGWYRANGITAPDWIDAAEQKGRNPDRLLTQYEARYQDQHAQNVWAHFVNIGLAFWLITSPPLLQYTSTAMTLSDIGAGVALLILAGLSLSWRMPWARWGCALVGIWLLFAPLIFWTTNAAAYLNDTLIGTLVIGFAVLTRPTPGVSPVAAMTGPTIPPGWSMNPSSWFQRMPIIALALVGLFVSRYLTAYQLEQIDGVWDPFFGGNPNDPQNGTEEIITSDVSKAWPIPDAGLGAITYALEILTGLIGSSRRWRTMPWMVMLFGIMIVPLGVVSITFIIIQPIIIGTWCALCLIAAAAMLIQIPYSLDELVATGQFLYRRRKAGRPLLKIFFVGDTDEDGSLKGKNGEDGESDFFQGPVTILKDVVGGGVNVPWNLALCLAIGIWLMLTRITLGAEGGMANWDHLIGSLVLTIAVIALAEVARPVRFAIIPLAACLFVTPFVYSVGLTSMVASVICGVLLIVLCLRRGKIRGQYGNWSRLLF